LTVITICWALTVNFIRSLYTWTEMQPLTDNISCIIYKTYRTVYIPNPVTDNLSIYQSIYRFPARASFKVDLYFRGLWFWFGTDTSIIESINFRDKYQWLLLPAILSLSVSWHVSDSLILFSVLNTCIDSFKVK